MSTPSRIFDADTSAAAATPPAGREAAAGATFAHILRARAASEPARLAFSFIGADDGPMRELTYGALDRQASAVAARLRAAGVGPGDRVVIACPSGLAFISTLFGCFYAGAIAVPTTDPHRLGRTAARLLSIALDARPRIGVTTAAMLSRLTSLGVEAGAPPLPWLAVGETADDPSEGSSVRLDVRPAGTAHEAAASEVAASEAALPFEPTPDTIAVIQYTSGSTSTPKGVVLTHRNLVHNQSLIAQVANQSADSVFVGWLPPYHDMGLIGLILHPIWLGARCVLLPTRDFLRRPYRWLEAISQHRATTTVAPNFAFDFCVERIGEEERRTLDLSSLQAVVNGAEPVRDETLTRFCAAFEPCGFRSEALMPCYGLAEATLLVTGRHEGAVSAARRCWIDPAALQQGHVACVAAETDGARALVSCGRPAAGVDLLIVDPETRLPVPPTRAGEIWIHGDSVGAGYWQRLDDSRATFGGRLANGDPRLWLRTGDLGFLRDGELYVSGRSSDLIVIRGRNIHPEDVERTCSAAHPAVMPHACTAFSVDSAEGEQLVIAQEVRPDRDVAPELLCDMLRRAVALDHDVEPAVIVLLRPNQVPRTSSGKIRRKACREAWQAGALAVLHTSRFGGLGRVDDLPCPTRDELLPLSPEARAGRLADALRRMIATIAELEEENAARLRFVHDAGLDSVHVAKLQQRLYDRLGVAPAAIDVFGGATIDDVATTLARALDAASDEASGDALNAPSTGRDEATRTQTAAHRLTPPQLALWFEYERRPASSAYHIGGAVHVRTPLDLSAVRRAFARVLARHVTLRSTFDVTPDGIFQRAQPHVEPPIATIDAADWTEAQLLDALTSDYNRPFDLHHDIPIRARLYRRSGSETVILIVVHHLASDYRSLEVLTREWLECYQEDVEGWAPPARRAAAAYADYADWYADQLRGVEGERLQRFWHDTLAGDIPVLTLPLRSHVDASTARRAGQHLRLLDASLSQTVAATARAAGTTPFVVLLSTFAILLHRYSQTPDIAIGTAAAVRPASRFADTIGYCVNTIVCRSTIAPGDRVHAVLRHVQTQMARALDHAAQPLSAFSSVGTSPASCSYDVARLQAMFVAYVSELERGLDLSKVALQVPGAALPLAGCSVETIRVARSHCQMDLQIAVAPCDGRLACAIDYDADLFEPETIERLAEHYEILLREVVSQTNRTVGELRLLTTEEEAQLDRWNDTAVAYDEVHVLHRLVDAQAARQPSAIAVSCDRTGESLTFDALRRRSDDLACRLVSLGARPDTPVAVLLEPCLDLPVALVAILKAGAPYIPIDPHDGRARIQRMLANAGASVVITHGAIADALALHEMLGEISGAMLALDRHHIPSAPNAARAALPDVTPGSLAYIIYTSGSTGEPKGAMNSHRAICNRLLWMRDRYPLDPAVDRILHKTPYTFDVSVWELFLPLISGVEMVIVRPGGHRDPAYLVEMIQRRAITMLHFVPSMLRMFLEEPGVDRCATIRRVICSGEALPPTLRDMAFARLSAEVHNLYGPTEAAVDVTSWECRRGDDDPVVPIGHPIANLRLFILDARQRRVPVGVAGELYLTGTGVGEGYWRQPELTAASFVTLRLEDGRTHRAYRTGDRARYRADGSVEFLGRLDHQVKIRGVRIELGEVEAALRALPGVRDCAVAVRQEDESLPRLVAYLVAGEALPPLRDLRGLLRSMLPDAFVPAHFCLLDALPMTTSGKVARSALPPIEACRTLTEGTLEMPATAEEEMLAEVWGEVLGVAQIGATDNFFELGGDSLRCLQVRTRALRRGYAFSIEQLFAHPTVRQLAQVLERRDASIDDMTPRCAPFALVSPEIRRALPADAVDAFPLSKLQEALLYHSQHDPAYEIYLLSLTVRAPLHEQALRDTLSMLAARHPMLRISYDTRSFDALLQIVHRNATIPLAIDDLSTLPADEQERAIDAWIDGERHHHFDWHAAPLLRVRVHRRSTSAFQLTVSHALYDGWSLSSAIVELLGDYLARVAGRPSPLQPPPAIDYREFVLAEQEAIESAECRTFWTRTLADAPAAGLPLATMRGDTAAASAPAASTPRKERVRRRVPIAAPVTAGLRDLARSAHAPLKSALLAAHLRVVALLTGTRDVTTGLITNGRLEQPDGDRVLGLFLNTVPLRVRFDRESWRDAVRLTFAAEQDLWPHRRFPLAEIRSIAGRTPFDTAFNFINFHVYDQVRGTDGMDIVDWKNPSDLTYFPLCAYFTEDPVSNQLLFYLDYDAALVEPEDAERAVHYYLAALTAAAEHPDATAADTELLSDRERAEQDRWAVPDRTATTEATATTEWTPIHRLIEAVAARQPEAPAVIAADTSLTYGQLDRRTNALARRLRAAGVTSETPVAIVVDRTPDLIVAVLAALKSGAAFVPIDSSQPRERLASIVEDSGLRLAIVDGHAAPGLLGDDVREIAVDAESDDEVTTQPQSPGGETTRDVARGVALDAIAYIMFTSGSTGKPKGVEVTHRGLTNIVQSVSAEVGISSRDRWLAVTSLSFDISLLELLVPLGAGGQVVLATSRGARDGGYLAELIDRAAATIMQATPSMWRLLLEAGWRGREGLRILCGGEALTRSLANDLLTRAALVWNVYGPTETTIWSAFSRVEADGREPVIGRPFANTTLHVLDERGQRVPAGVPGELYIGGAGVARGYRGRPDQTRERFVAVSAANLRHAQPRDRGEAETADVDNAAMPSDGFDASRLYRTGDRVRWRRDGQLEYLGRLDGQIKIRGFRVELAEIEHALKRDADVGDAVVTVRRIASDDVRLVAWVVPADGRTPTAAELKARAARVLPVYMVPAELVLIPAFPLTPNGKADRRALASMQRPDGDFASASSPSLAAAASAAVASNTAAASATATERIVTRIWQELLTNGAISRDDNLFDMGAHSLLVMRACLRIERECGIALTPVTAFQYPTIAALAAFIDGQAPAVAADDRVMSTRRDRGGAALAPALQRMIQRRQAAWQAEQPAAHAAPEAS